MSNVDLTRFFIPHERLIVHEMIPGKRIDTFAPLPALAAHWHATGEFPRRWVESLEPIIPDPFYLVNLLGEDSNE